MSLRPFWIAVLATVFAGGLLSLPDLLMVDGGTTWEGFHTQQKTLTFFCEPAQVEAFIRQPADTYSNLAFLFVGTLMVAFGFQDRKAPVPRFIQRHPSWSFLFGGTLILLFLASAFFHASLTRFAEWLDLAAVYGAMWLPVFFNGFVLSPLRRRGKPASRSWQILFFVVWGICCLLIFRVKAWYSIPWALVLIGLTSLRVQYLRPGNWKWLAVSMSLSLFAIMWFSFDVRRIFCDPDSWMQPHAIWHLADAATAGTFYAYMRSHA